MRTLGSLILSCSTALLMACGGGDPVQGPTESGESPTLDFSAVAGAWAGWGVEPRGEGESDDIHFWMRASLSSSAGIGSTVGSIEYGLADPSQEPDCRGNWIAQDAENPVYVVAERITSGSGCPDGTVRLALDDQTGALSYDFTADGGPDAEGTLRRGTDPGPRP